MIFLFAGIFILGAVFIGLYLGTVYLSGWKTATLIWFFSLLMAGICITGAIFLAIELK